LVSILIPKENGSIMEATDRVSEAVFPAGDKKLQAPDNMAGFVIEDRKKRCGWLLLISTARR
jgi:hypothetical protein